MTEHRKLIGWLHPGSGMPKGFWVPGTIWGPVTAGVSAREDVFHPFFYCPQPVTIHRVAMKIESDPSKL